MTSAGSVGGDERLRLFLALELPPATLDELTTWGLANLSGGRIVAREHLHVTLAFLGSRPAAEVDAIVRVLRDAVAAEPEPIMLEPTRWRETRSVGMLALADHGGAATRLAGRCHAGLEALGVYRAEARSWLPHLTLLRFRERPRLEPPLPGTGTFVPSDAAAYLSRLHPTGARYEVLERVSLIAGG
ncbi:MAG TPA: 2'-5' RNA ligase family protein [Gaiella sp.]|jgi:2'-5' RNA ligase|nr:2'-5' RNA ligase family protein [Gaiella sp.]